LCARFLIYRCKHSNAHPEMIQYFNMIIYLSERKKQIRLTLWKM